MKMMDMGANTLDVEVRPHNDGARVVTLDVNVQTPLWIVDIMIPTGWRIKWHYPRYNYLYWGMDPIL